MTLYDRRKEKLCEELKDKEYRDAFVEESISIGIPFQIKALRKQRNLNQIDLEKLSGMKQARISLLENHGYSEFTLKTLKKFASAFDVGLIVRFVPISEMVEWELNLSPESLEALSYKDEPYFKEKPEEEISTKSSIGEVPQYRLGSNVNVINFNECKKRREISKIEEASRETGLQKVIGVKS